MITLYQEQVPFSNTMFNGAISQDKKFTNPVIIPYAINSALGDNVLETVIYIKNTDQSKYYKNVVISLMYENIQYSDHPADTIPIVPTSTSGSLSLNTSAPTFSLLAFLNIPVDLAYTYPGTVPTTSITLLNSYKTSYVPVVNAPGSLNVKFSYGYDELSLTKWDAKNSMLVIPTIGTSGLGDTSYIPIRMRITNPSKLSFVTNRDYFIDISYSDELIVGA